MLRCVFATFGREWSKLELLRQGDSRPDLARDSSITFKYRESAGQWCSCRGNKEAALPGTTAVSRYCGAGQREATRLGSGGPALQAAALRGHRAEKRFQSYQELLKMPKMPLKAPLAFFDNSLSQNEDYEHEELIELTANFDDDSLEDDDDATVDSWNTADLEEQEREEKRREKYFNIYKVTWLANICFHD